jgi:hypothetical protein
MRPGALGLQESAEVVLRSRKRRLRGLCTVPNGTRCRRRTYIALNRRGRIAHSLTAGRAAGSAWHHCHVVNIRGNSYRMREHADLRLGLQPSSHGATAQSVLRRKKKEIPAH